MNKPKVLFPYVEAGMGHIIPMRAIAAKFKDMYGARVDCEEVKFFADSGNANLIEFEHRMCDSVIKSNRNKALGFFITFSMNFWGTKIASKGAAEWLKSGVAKPAVEHMEELAPDLVVSTHWSTNYFANKCEKPPLTVKYCPDTGLYPLFEYPCDVALTPTHASYDKALKKHKRRFNCENLKCVPTLIRQEAFEVGRDKKALRENLGLNPDKYTVLLAEGGYGIGRMTEICREALKRDIKATIIPVCGKNEELYNELKSWKSGNNCEFCPVGYTEHMLEYLAASDLFCGKSGANIFAEATFLGVPQIVTKYASGIEKMNGEYYVKKIKTALKIFNAKKAVKKIEEFAADPLKAEPLRLAAEAQRENFGAEKTAEIIFELLCTKFPELKQN